MNGFLKTTILCPNAPNKCKIDLKNLDAVSPHHHITVGKRSSIASSILDLVGDTPLVRLNKIPKEEGVECEILAKCDFLSPGGSIKDRIAKRMVEEGEAAGRYHSGDTLIEPTSGNTGIGLALVSAVKDYNCCIVMPDKMSQEKSIILQALGATVIRTPREALYDQLDSHLQRAASLREELSPGAHIPDQYTNPYNPIAHYDCTAREIFNACAEGEPEGKPRVDMVVCGSGTGGTVTGIGYFFKQNLPSCMTVAVDPHGSSLAEPSLGPDDASTAYEVEGIGYEFCPTVLSYGPIDQWVRVDDKESFDMARRLIRCEGLLVGGSSGSAVVGAIKAIKQSNLGKGHRVVVILPDSCRNYLTKFVSDSWMTANGFLPLKPGDYFKESFRALAVMNFLTLKQKRQLPQIDCKCSIKEARHSTAGKLAMVVRDGAYLGVLAPVQVLQKLLSAEVSAAEQVEKLVDKSYKRVTKSDSMSTVLRFLAHHSYVIVIGEDITEGAYAIDSSDVLDYEEC